MDNDTMKSTKDFETDVTGLTVTIFKMQIINRK